MKWFNRKELECKCGCGFDTVDYELAKVLDELREYYDKPIHINSGCRCYKHNIAIGGSKNSKHVLGSAADIVVKDVPSDDVYEYLITKYPTTYGIGKYLGRTHIDIRKEKARWNG